MIVSKSIMQKENNASSWNFTTNSLKLLFQRWLITGIVYTPDRSGDSIIHSVDDVLKNEFGRSISDENIHILLPFTETGTFISQIDSKRID